MPRPHFNPIKSDALRVETMYPCFLFCFVYFRAPQVMVMCSQGPEVLTHSSWSHRQPFSFLWVDFSTPIALWSPSVGAKTAFQFNSVQLHTVWFSTCLFSCYSTVHFWVCLPWKWWEPCFSNRRAEILEFISFCWEMSFKRTVICR